MKIDGPATKDSRMAQLLQRLRKAGLRQTDFRRNLFTLLIHKEPYALSVEEIRAHPLAGNPDTVTVYRNVETLTRIGLLDCIADDNGRFRYRLSEFEGPKLKIACRDCHATFFKASPVLPQLENLARELGYKTLNAKWEITGYCEDCSTKP